MESAYKRHFKRETLENIPEEWNYLSAYVKRCWGCIIYWFAFATNIGKYLLKRQCLMLLRWDHSWSDPSVKILFSIMIYALCYHQHQQNNYFYWDKETNVWLTGCLQTKILDFGKNQWLSGFLGICLEVNLKIDRFTTAINTNSRSKCTWCTVK